MDLNTKKCTCCKQTKPFSDFSKDNRAKSKLQTRCKDCQKQIKKQNADYYREWHLQNKYGISHSDYLVFLDEQNNCCKICGIHEKHCEYSRLAVDHDHKTGVIRGLLCKKCNKAIGLLQDNADFCRAAAEYLDAS